jgi:hypothetical protein
MKNTKSILMAAAAALTIASASANEVIYITGATAFRSAANNTLYSKYGQNLYAYSGAATNTADAIALYFTNCTLPNGNKADLAVTWTGSEGGIQSVASPAGNPVTVPFYNKTQISNAAVAGTLAGSAPYKLAQPDTANMIAGTYTSLQKGQVGCSDSFQASSRFAANRRASDGKTYRSLTMQEVGVVPYAWIASKGFADTFPDRNISYFNAFQALRDGYISGNAISGKEADADVNIFTVGRNVDSGTRVIALANLRYGVTAALNQWECTASGGNITKMIFHPAKTLNGVSTPVGGGGESSGGVVASYMTNVITDSTINDDYFLASTNYLIGYVSVADISSARRTAGLRPLKYNGVEGRCHDNASFTTLDAGYTNICNGSYPYWGYEFVTYDNTQITANGKNFADDIVTSIRSFASTNSIIAPNIKLSDMKVERSADGGVLLNK